MSFKLHQEPQVHPTTPEAQLQLQLDHLKRTVASPHDLVEHIIQLYGAEFAKANECIAKLKSELDLLALSKQGVMDANRELMHRNNELATANTDWRLRVEQIALALKDVPLDAALRTLLTGYDKTSPEHAQPVRADGNARPNKASQ